MSIYLTQPTLESVPEFLRELDETRKEMTTKDWREFVSFSPAIRRWRYFLCHDPYTRWGLLKPKGFAGDAQGMDFAYRHPSINAEVKQSGRIGQAIYAHTSGFDHSRSVRQRKNFVAKYLNEFVENRGVKASKIKVASYACGHGRELEGFELDTFRAIDCFYAIDTDSDALDEIKKHQGVLHLKAIQKSVFRFQPEVYQFDVVYSMGLLDCLNAEQSRMLLEKMYTALRPGGRLLIDNLDMEAGNIAYCEAMMDWWRILKSEDELITIADKLPGASSADRIHIEKSGCTNYLLIEKGDEYIGL